MPRELIDPTSLHSSPGYSHIALAKGGQMAYIAGQVALGPDWDESDDDPGIIGGDDIYEQTKAAMRNVGRALEEISASWDDVVRRTIYTLRPTEWDAMRTAIDEVTGGAGDPAQTILGVKGLALEGLLLEIECTVSLGLESATEQRIEDFRA